MESPNDVPITTPENTENTKEAGMDFLKKLIRIPVMLILRM
jgi:hypothetical protein